MQDGRDGAELYRLLEEEVVPTYYDHRAAWVAKVKRALMTVGPQFGAGRMVGDYAEQLYAQVATPA
jgi:starch phosphorylase